MKRLVTVLLALWSGSLFAQSQRLELAVSIDAQNETAKSVTARAIVTNPAARNAEAISVQLFALSETGVEIIAADPSWTCGAASSRVSCSFNGPLLAPGAQVTLPFTVHFANGAGRVPINPTLFWQWQGETGTTQRFDAGTVNAALFHELAVTNANDSGAGSLRNAIESLNADPLCASAPCSIAFAGGVTTIAPLSALPAITATDVKIDGGQRVALSGAKIGGYADGLEIHANIAVVRGLDISGFLANGLHYYPAPEARILFEQNVIHGNGQRGLTLEPGNYHQSLIRDNVLNANARSGLFIVASTNIGFSIEPILTIRHNRMEYNGASGAFVGPDAQQVVIADNDIKFNRDFGVAIAARTSYVTVAENRIVRNGNLGIDIGLDGRTPAIGPLPTLQSATYDAATDTTTITGTGVANPGGEFVHYDYSFYANDNADAEAEQFLGTVASDSSGRITFVFPGDLRGKWITAQTVRAVNLDGSIVHDSSELSEAIVVR